MHCALIMLICLPISVRGLLKQAIQEYIFCYCAWIYNLLSVYLGVGDELDDTIDINHSKTLEPICETSQLTLLFNNYSQNLEPICETSQLTLLFINYSQNLELICETSQLTLLTISHSYNLEHICKTSQLTLLTINYSVWDGRCQKDASLTKILIKMEVCCLQNVQKGY